MPLAAGAQQDRPRARRSGCWSWRAELNARLPFADTFMISALDGDGVADLKALPRRSVPAGPWHYPADEVTDAPLRLLAAEITREKIFDRLHDELPYQVDGRDHRLEGAEERRAHRADDLRRARQPEGASCWARAAA